MTDIVVGCNFSNPKFSPDYTIMTDTRPLRKVLKRGFPNTIPYVLSPKGLRYLECEKKRVLSNIQVKDTIPVQKFPSISPKIPMNSGMHGVIYSIEHEDPIHHTIQLWGMDSLWTGDLSSLTDNIIPKSLLPEDRGYDKINVVWKKYWSYLFNLYKEKTFIIRVPSNQEKNVILNPRNFSNLHIQEVNGE
jgi:hypothetical protein